MAVLHGLESYQKRVAQEYSKLLLDTVPSHQNVRPPKWSFFCFSFPPKWSEQNDRQMSWNDRVRGNFEVSHQNDRASSGTKLPTKMIERKFFPTKMIASQSHVTLIVITLHQHKPCTSLVYVGFKRTECSAFSLQTRAQFWDETHFSSSTLAGRSSFKKTDNSGLWICTERGPASTNILP